MNLNPTINWMVYHSNMIVFWALGHWSLDFLSLRQHFMVCDGILGYPKSLACLQFSFWMTCRSQFWLQSKYIQGKIARKQ